MPNSEALWSTLLHIEANPETWRQDRWVCGTAHCFAGHTAVTVLKATLIGELVPLTKELATTMNRWEVDYGLSVCPWTEDDAPHVDDFARSVLGLTREQADDLFCATNTLPELRRMVVKFTGEDRPPLDVPRETPRT
jgi:hypothetical protein